MYVITYKKAGISQIRKLCLRNDKNLGCGHAITHRFGVFGFGFRFSPNGITNYEVIINLRVERRTRARIRRKTHVRR